MLRRRFYYWLYRAVQVGEFDGIGLASASQNDAMVFASTMSRALDLIKTHDPRRYLRVRQHILWIVNAAHHHGAGGASYHPYLKRCKFDFSDFGWDEERHLAAYYAHQMVHEATHGWLHSRGFRYTRKTRLQHERICHAEQNRFLKRLDRYMPGVYESFVSEFNPADWDVSWSFLQRKRKELGRICDRGASQPSNAAQREKSR